MAKPRTRALDPFDPAFREWTAGAAAGHPNGDGSGTAAARGRGPRTARDLASFHAYVNSRADKDWNTCGQAAIASMADYHGKNPYNLPRVGRYWDDGAAIDATINGGFGPDVVFGWGTTGGRIRDALSSYGLHASVGYSGAFSLGWQHQWDTLRAYVAQDLPVPVLVDLGALPGGPSWTAHWPIVHRIDAGKVHLANCGWAPVIDESVFLNAWHAWYLPYKFNHCAVYAY